MSLRRVHGGDVWELVHPPCAEERADDLAEVEQMLDAGETDIAREELRWLLEGCRDLLTAHRLLGEIALAEGDWKLARAHFGYAYQLGVDALPPEGLAGRLAYSLPANRPFFQAAKGLAWCFRQLELADKAREVIERLLSLDSSDPLNVRALLAITEGDSGSPIGS